MGLNISEQETSVNFSRDSDICTVYTSDNTVMTKLDKFLNFLNFITRILAKLHFSRLEHFESQLF